MEEIKLTREERIRMEISRHLRWLEGWAPNKVKDEAFNRGKKIRLLILKLGGKNGE